MTERNGRLLARLRFILWGLVIVVGVGATILYFVRPPERPLGLFGGEFAVETTQGETFTQDDLRGTPSLVFFGYTYCPDVCPTTLAESVQWRQAVGAGPDELRVIFVTVDPERDTPESLRTYLDAFSPDVIGLRGESEADTDAIKSAFAVYSQKVDDASSTEYLVDHTANVFLIAADGSFEGTIAWGEDAETALAKIRRLIS